MLILLNLAPKCLCIVYNEKHKILIFRHTGQGTTPQAEALARNVEARLNELLETVNQAVNRVEKSGIQQPAPTVVGRLEQARRWLEQPGIPEIYTRLLNF